MLRSNRSKTMIGIALLAVLLTACSWPLGGAITAGILGLGAVILLLVSLTTTQTGCSTCISPCLDAVGPEELVVTPCLSPIPHKVLDAGDLDAGDASEAPKDEAPKDTVEG